MNDITLRLRGIFSFMRFYEKYGFWGIILIAASIASIVIGVIISIIFIHKISSIYILTNNKNISVADTSMIGDFFGGVVGTIWSFAGVMLFFLALRLQSKELNLQIKELKSTREVFSIQQFENTFFNLLKTQNDIRLSLEYSPNQYISQTQRSDENYKAHQVFEHIRKGMIKKNKELNLFFNKYKRLALENDPELDLYITQIQSHFGNKPLQEFESEIMLSKLVYKEAFKKFQNQLGHYFRNLYHILLYIKENEEMELGIQAHEEFLGTSSTIYINGKSMDVERIKRKYKKYADFVQAQMSGAELFLLFYNCMFFKKLKRLIQYYNLLDNLTEEDLLNPDREKNFYSDYYHKGEKIPSIYFKSSKEIMKL